MLDAIRASYDAGKLRIYSGSVPANADAALGGAVLLAELTLNATAFPAASGGVLTANAITSDTSADNTGTASFFRILDSGASTVLFQGAVSTSGAELNLNTTSIVAAALVGVSSLTITIPATV
jgi:hypothetical protein